MHAGFIFIENPSEQERELLKAKSQEIAEKLFQCKENTFNLQKLWIHVRNGSNYFYHVTDVDGNQFSVNISIPFSRQNSAKVTYAQEGFIPAESVDETDLEHSQFYCIGQFIRISPPNQDSQNILKNNLQKLNQNLGLDCYNWKIIKLWIQVIEEGSNYFYHLLSSEGNSYSVNIFEAYNLRIPNQINFWSQGFVSASSIFESRASEKEQSSQNKNLGEEFEESQLFTVQEIQIEQTGFEDQKKIQKGWKTIKNLQLKQVSLINRLMNDYNAKKSIPLTEYIVEGLKQQISKGRNLLFKLRSGTNQQLLVLVFVPLSGSKYASLVSISGGKKITGNSEVLSDENDWQKMKPQTQQRNLLIKATQKLNELTGQIKSNLFQINGLWKKLLRGATWYFYQIISDDADFYSIMIIDIKNSRNSFKISYVDAGFQDPWKFQILKRKFC